jgi:hypothetical protein
MRRWMVLGLWLVSVVVPAVATAGPRPLTPAQMDMVTAGIAGLTLNLNLNVTTQTAVPIAVAVAACGTCRDLAAAAVAVGRNVNRSELVNATLP